MNETAHLIANMAAVLVTLLLAWPRVRRLGLGIYDIIDGAFWLMLGCLGGGWAANALPRIVDTLAGGDRYLPWWAAGEHWMGVVAGGAVLGYLWLWRRGLPIGPFFDALAPVAPIALAVIRIGCYLHADAYGRPTDSPIAMWLPDVNGDYAYRYPTQLVSLTVNLLLAGLLYAFEARARRQGKAPGWPFPGFLFLLYVELYCLGRIYFEFWRGDMYPWVGPFTYSHLYAFIGIFLATWGIVRGLRSQATARPLEAERLPARPG